MTDPTPSMTTAPQVNPSNPEKETNSPPYWHINVPPSHRPTKCPDFLLDISDRNKAMINFPQDQYHILTWPEVQNLIRTNQIDKFSRSPADHRKYMEYMYGLKQDHGSVMDLVRDKRLGWTDMKPKGAAFQDPDDLKILYNDWPYGIDPQIIHLCVWTKFPLDDDPETDDLTPRMRTEIEGFVDRTFRGRVKGEDVIWFKNWSSLKSIHSMEHFHVMLNDPDMEFIREVTNGDVAVSSEFVGG